MTSLPDDFIARFGSDRDLMFFPSEEFLAWAGQEVLKSEDEEGEAMPYFLYRLGSVPELVRSEVGDNAIYAGTNVDSPMNELDAEILENAKKVGKRRKWKESLIYDISLETGKPPKDPMAFLGASTFDKSPGRKMAALVRGEGTSAQILGIYDRGTAAGLTPMGLRAIADDIFQAGSEAEWFLGFASAPQLDFIESNPDGGTVPNFTYWVNSTNCFDSALTGTGGDRMVGFCTAPDWFLIPDWGTITATGTDLLMEGTDSAMLSDNPSLYLRFDFNFSAADLVAGDDPIPYDFLFVYRGEGTAVDFVCQMSEPDDARLNPGARVEALFNVSAMGILEI